MGWQYPEWKSQPIMAGAKSMPSFLATRWTPWTAEKCSTSLVSSRHWGTLCYTCCVCCHGYISSLLMWHAPGGSMDGWNSSTLPYSFRGTLPCENKKRFHNFTKWWFIEVLPCHHILCVLICPFFVVLRTWLSVK